ncbi:MAG: alpha/beta hydrolase [Verrucomicrobiia bacterium]
MKRLGGAKGLVGIGLGAGLAGAAAVALRYALRPRERRPIPDSISSPGFSSRVARTSVGQIVYHEAGKGPSLLFLHGGFVGASSYEWSKVYPDFARTHRVLALDLIGFGESERPQNLLGAFDHVRALQEFIESICPDERVTIVGSHLGGGFATLLASQNPDRVGRLLLLMPTGLTEFGLQPVPSLVTLACRVPLLGRFLSRNAFAHPSAIRRWMMRFGFHDADQVSEEAVETFATCAQQYGAQNAVLSLLQKRFHFDFEQRWKSLPVPAALLWSANSTAAPLEWAYRLMAMAPRDCSLDVIPSSSLLVALERADAVRDILHTRLDHQIRLLKPSN